MITVADAELLERTQELDTLRALLEDARHGCGGIALVEGPAGQGKSTLLRALRAEADGLRVLTAVGAELERDFPHGIVRQLMPDALVDPLPGESCQARLHALVQHAAAQAAEQPLLIVVDDAHWADAGSLKVLGMLARRVEDLPIALVIGLRPTDSEPLLADLFAAPAAIVLQPAPLSPDAVAHLVAAALDGEIEPAFAAAAAETTGGNPLLVRELRRTLARGGFTGAAAEADAVRRAVPGSIARLVQGRLGRLSPAAVALARAVAALCERTTSGVAAALAGLDDRVAAQAHLALADAGLLEPARLAFTHPMMREAVLAGLVPSARSTLHRRAARLLHETGASEDDVAAQLLAAEPGNDAHAAALLTRTGRRAFEAGDTDVALDHLRRALAERAEADSELLLALGLAEARAGDPAGHERLARAASAEDPAVAARAQQARARLLMVAGCPREAAAALVAGLERAEGELAAQLEDDLLDGLIYESAPERARRLAAADDRPVVLAHRAFDAAATGRPAAEVRALARRALSGGALLTDAERPAVLYAIEALMAVEAADESRAAIDALADASCRAGSRVGAGAVALVRARWEHEFGDLDASREAARVAIELHTGLSGRTPSAPLRAVLGAALLDAGDVDGAEAILEGARHPWTLPICGFHALRGRVLLARGRPEEALAEVERQFALEAPRGWRMTFREPSRMTYALALAEAGRLEEARAFADEYVAMARARGMHGAEARMLLASSRLALAREEEIATLRAAVEAARRSPSALIQAEALTALGSALRRAGQRAQARDPLREARELALRAGAQGLEKRAHDELVVAGARPQRVAQHGPEGLTPSERRVAELAAQGRRNREIAEALFVTPKTVEVHLGRAYGKLGISSRSQLAAALIP